MADEAINFFRSSCMRTATSAVAFRLQEVPLHKTVTLDLQILILIKVSPDKNEYLP